MSAFDLSSEAAAKMQAEATSGLLNLMQNLAGKKKLDTGAILDTKAKSAADYGALMFASGREQAFKALARHLGEHFEPPLTEASVPYMSSAAFNCTGGMAIIEVSDTGFPPHFSLTVMFNKENTDIETKTRALMRNLPEEKIEETGETRIARLKNVTADVVVAYVNNLAGNFRIKSPPQNPGTPSAAI